jgi:hypothetical protein
MLTPNDLPNDFSKEHIWSSHNDEWYKSPQQWSLTPQFYSGLLNGNSSWTCFQGGLKDLEQNSLPVSDLIEYERTKDALELTTEFESLELNKQFSLPPSGYVCKLCMVKGHWLKNCTLYQERKRENIKTFGPLAMKPQLANRLLANQQITLPIRSSSSPPEGYVCRKCHTPGHW